MLPKLITASALFCSAGLLIYHNTTFMISNYQLKFSSLPKELEKKRFLLITDLHFCVYGEQNRKLLKKIEACEPDYIFIAGDLVTGNQPHKAKFALDFLKHLVKCCPVFYAPGNHENYWRSFESGEEEWRAGFEKSQKKADYTYQEYIEMAKKIGVSYLSNEQTLLKQGLPIQVFGLDLPLPYFKQKEEDLLNARKINTYLGICDKRCFSILLAHDPFYFQTYADWGADLILSGHVHGGLLRLPKLGGVLSPRMEWFPHYDAGVYQNGASTMLLSRGLGSHTLPLRFFNRPELVVFECEQA